MHYDASELEQHTYDDIEEAVLSAAFGVQALILCGLKIVAFV